MVKEPRDEKTGKRIRNDGEPAAKRYCKQLSETSPLQLVQFTGTNQNEGKSQATKRNAPQDSLSATIYPTYK